MKKLRYDYSGFSLKKLNEQRFRHLWLLAGWLVYFAMYFITENLIPLENCHVIHCGLDDIIPFCEYFAVFYVGWYALVFFSLAYTLFYDVERFKQLQWYIIITQIVAMVCYIVYPSVQDLRPETFERNNVFTWIMGFIYSFDTPSGICPSLHVAYSVAIIFVLGKDRDISRFVKTLLTLLVIMICLAVCFVKQHSFVDVVAALPVCLLGEAIVFGGYWKRRLSGEKKT